MVDAQSEASRRAWGRVSPGSASSSPPSPSNPLQDPRTTSTLKPTNHYEYSEHSGQDKFNLQRDVKLVHAPRWSELKHSHILKWVKLKQVERFPAEFFGIIHSFGLPSQSTIVALASCASMEPRSPTCKKRSSTGRFVCDASNE